ncbi:hypothetical protein QJS10_CPB11g00443 [Acorus calamus]|uniref:Ubiquitin-like domain-containing protein n=1 Tax=Acorus calamus TaxID=4465 RepID=A0AAV9DTD7_ACOCL|nr:hypothetical protein QJS10_CPB11g00443 [Acorus calamus]
MAWTHRHSEIVTGEFTTVAELKREVHRVCRAMYDMQLIVHDGKLVHDEEAHPSRYGVGQGSLIYLYKKELTYMGALMRDGDLVCDYVIGEALTEAIQIIELPRDEQRMFEIEATI